MNKRYLVTGGAGFIGSHLVDALIVQGHAVTVIDNLSHSTKEHVHERAHFIKGDIRDYPFETLGIFDGIFHLASISRIQPSIVDPITSDAVNIHGTVRILTYAKTIRAKVVFASSSSIYGNQKKFPASETAPSDILSPYSLQKLTCDAYLDLFQKLYGLRYAIVRYFNVYGERQIATGEFATIIGIFLHQYRNGLPFTIVGDGSQRRDFTYVADAVDATMRAMDHSSQALLCNIGTGRNYSILEIAELISLSHPKIFLSVRPGEYDKTCADITNARELLAWEPRVVLAEWIKKQVAS